jgi:hypothetical protein
MFDRPRLVFVHKPLATTYWKKCQKYCRDISHDLSFPHAPSGDFTAQASISLDKGYATCKHIGARRFLMDGAGCECVRNFFSLPIHYFIGFLRKRAHSERLDKTLSEFVNNQSDCDLCH